MKNIFSKIIMIAALSLSVQVVVGQVGTSLYFMDNLPQSSILNPAFDPNYDFYIGIPIINNTNSSFSSDIGLGDVYQNGEFFWNSKGAYNKFVNDLSETSYLSADLNSNIFSLGFATGKSGYFHFAMNSRSDMTMGIPRDLFRMNDMTINHDLSTFEMQARSYFEYAFGYSYAINDNLVIGAKFKFLNGLACISTDFDQLDLTTGDEAWRVKMEGAVDIVAPIDVILDAEGKIVDVEELIDFGSLSDWFDYGMSSFQNKGFGIDLGAEYRIMPQLKLSASIIDLGRIGWKNNATNLNFDDEYTFKGFENVLTTDGDGININDDFAEGVIDSLENLTTATKSNNKFSTTLSPKVFLGAEYEFTEALSVGMLYKARFVRKEVRQNLYFNANANLKKVLTLGLNYNLGIKSQNSYGGVIGVRLTPFYIYIAADVLPGIGSTKLKDATSTTLDLPFGLPSNLGAANIQFGLNFVLGNRQRKISKARKPGAVNSIFNENLGNSAVKYPL